MSCLNDKAIRRAVVNGIADLSSMIDAVLRALNEDPEHIVDRFLIPSSPSIGLRYLVYRQ
jgi:hypothetical protein